jgi:6-phosphogluconolactonase
MSDPTEVNGSAIEVRVFRDLERLSRAAAAAVMHAADTAMASRGRFTISLAGGNTPRGMYELLATEHRDKIPWHSTHVFFGDERCVPPTDAASNYRMASEALLARVPIPADHVHRIRGELPPEEAAREYGRLLRRVLAGWTAGAGTEDAEDAATFDAALLGAGADGHTASLFPGSSALDERHHWVVAVEAPEYVAPPRTRVTLTFPVLCRARAVFVLAAGTEKRHVVEAVLGRDASAGEPGAHASRDPVARERGLDGTTWFVDASVVSPPSAG